eukprot:11574815-Alexandrium_andersonii.AAC.1
MRLLVPSTAFVWANTMRRKATRNTHSLDCVPNLPVLAHSMRSGANRCFTLRVFGSRWSSSVRRISKATPGTLRCNAMRCNKD